jgi:hypothetical protein
MATHVVERTLAVLHGAPAAPTRAAEYAARKQILGRLDALGETPLRGAALFVSDARF